MDRAYRSVRRAVDREREARSLRSERAESNLPADQSGVDTKERDAGSGTNQRGVRLRGIDLPCAQELKDRCGLIRRHQQAIQPTASAIKWRKPKIAYANAGKSCFFTLGVFVGAEEKRLVPLQRAADRQSRLNAGERLFHWLKDARRRINRSGKCVSRLKRLVAKEAERIAVKLVASALRNDVDDAASGSSIFRIVVAED